MVVGKAARLGRLRAPSGPGLMVASEMVERLMGQASPRPADDVTVVLLLQRP